MNHPRAIKSGSLLFQRETVRHKIFEPVSLRIDGVPMRGHLLDLSQSGALAHAEGGIVLGARVELEGIGILTPARIIWVRGQRFGLRFDSWLSQLLVDRVVGGLTSPAAISETE